MKCHYRLVDNIFSNFESTLSQYLYNRHNLVTHFNNSQLKSFTIEFWNQITMDSIEIFLQANQQLKEFGVKQCFNIKNYIIPLVAQYSPKIEKFIFVSDPRSDFVENAEYLKQLTALKWLRNQLSICTICSGYKRTGRCSYSIELFDIIEFRCIGLQRTLRRDLKTKTIKNFDFSVWRN